GDDDARRDQAHLLLEEAAAGGHLVGLRVAVAGRTTLDDVGDVDVLAGEADGADDLGEQLPRRADEGQALAVFFGARAFADEHQVGVGVPSSEDDGAAALRQAAAGA